MNKINYISLLLLSIICFASCEKTIKVTPPPYASKFVVYSMPLIGDTIVASVGKSMAIINHKQYPDLTIHNATVQLFVNGTYVQNMPFDSSVGGYKSSVVAEAGKQYTLKVSAPSYPDASVDVVGAAEVTINDIKHIKNARIDENKNQQDEITITFNDPPSPGDYYILRIQPALDTYYTYWGFCVNTIDPSVENESNESIDITTCVNSNNIFVRDELFNGSQSN